jgi:hypothetical protein
MLLPMLGQRVGRSSAVSLATAAQTWQKTQPTARHHRRGRIAVQYSANTRVDALRDQRRLGVDILLGW